MGLTVKAGGAWRNTVGVSAKVAGAWRSVHTVYVKAGGVWRGVWAAAMSFMKGSTYGSASYVTKNSDHIECYAYNPGGTGGEAATVTTIPIDLTNVNYVQIDWTIEGQSTVRSDGLVIASPNRDGSGGDFAARYNTGAHVTRSIANLNVSPLTGYHYVRVHVSINGDILLWKRVRLYRVYLDGVEIWNASNPNSTLF